MAPGICPSWNLGPGLESMRKKPPFSGPSSTSLDSQIGAILGFSADKLTLPKTITMETARARITNLLTINTSII